MKISQREARALKRRVAELEDREASRFARWSNSCPGGTHICTVRNSGIATTIVSTARLLSHAVVVVNDGDNLLLYALPAPKS